MWCTLAHAVPGNATDSESNRSKWTAAHHGEVVVRIERLLRLRARLVAQQALAAAHVGLAPHGARYGDEAVPHQEDACTREAKTHWSRITWFA
jgi:hypothetical protein